MIEILEAGLQSTLQDLGRPGYGNLGVPEAGAADAFSLRLANRLVGNDQSAACIETLLGGLAVRFRTDKPFAIAGAGCEARLDDRTVATDSWGYARAGQVLTLRHTGPGLRNYLAVAGGFDVPLVLGSRSTDTLSGIGPAALTPGTRLKCGKAGRRGFFGIDVVVSPTVGHWMSLAVPVQLGPRDDLFAQASIDTLFATTWTISQETDRIAARLLGPDLSTAGIGQLPTEGLAAGSIQVPPSGQPIVHLANHPPTGGYPVIGVIDRSDVDRISQAAPGVGIRFTLKPAVIFG